MFFDKKVKRSMEVMNERNRKYLKEMNDECAEDADHIAEIPDEMESTEAHEKEYRRLNDETGFEKGDVPALIISALIVFSPIFLVLIGIIVLAWIFLS